MHIKIARAIGNAGIASRQPSVLLLVVTVCTTTGGGGATVVVVIAVLKNKKRAFCQMPQKVVKE